MPKKKKNAGNRDNENDKCPNDGRPSGRLTFGDFLTAQIEQSRAKTAQTEQSRVKAAQSSTPGTAPCPPESGDQSEVVKTDDDDLIGSTTSSLSTVNLESKDGGTSNEDNSNNQVKTTTKNNAVPQYYVCRSKKGGLSVKVENRSSGKKVTLIEHVRGEGKLLVQEMKTKFGTGGLFKEDTIELQGDCKVKVTKYLNDNKHLLKPYGTK